MARLRRYYSYVVPGRGIRIDEVDIGPDTPLPGDGVKLLFVVIGVVVFAVAVAAVATYLL